MSFIPSFLHPFTLATRVANLVLAKDEWAKSRLAEFSGNTVRLVLGPIIMQCSIAADGQLAHCDDSVVPNVTLTLARERFNELPHLIRQGDPSAIARLMHVEGDAGLATLVADVAQNTRLDLEAELASVVGDIAAVRLVQGTKGAVQAAVESSKRIAENMAEFLGEESQLLVSYDYAELWKERYAQLEAQLQHTEQRYVQLSHRLSSTRRA